MRDTLAILTISLSFMSAKADAATYFLGASFVTDSQTLIGTGTLSYEANAPLANGSYALNTLSNAGLSLQFANATFTLADLVTDPSLVHVEVRNGGFYFSNSNPNDTEPERGGAADFVNSQYYLTTQPVPQGSNSQVRFVFNAVDETPGAAQYGVYSPVAAVPEPSTAMVAIAGLGAVMLRRRRAA